MRAWQVAELGEPAQALHLVDMAVPEPGPGQALVRVSATALNFPDVLLCRGAYQVRPPLPFTPGVELCGEVVALGPDAAGSIAANRNQAGTGVGERVIGTPALPHGALAEYALLDLATTYPAPPALGDPAAASMHIAYQTGWFALHRRAQIRSGETLLVFAAAGGVGSAAVQLGKAAGAQVIAVVGGTGRAGAAKTKAALDLGADVVVNRREQDVVAAVKEITGGRGADVIFDPVGGDAYSMATRCVAFEGRILVIGFASGTVPAPGLNHALIKNYSIVGLHWGLYQQRDPAMVAATHTVLTALAEAGVVSPLVSEVLPLSRVPEGLTRLAAGETTGRIVVVL